MHPQHFEVRPAQLKWLLDSDPAIRWQVMRDLTAESADAIAAERSRIATEGWGVRLLSRQSSAGTWGGSREDERLLITLYTLVVLKDLGLDPAGKQARTMTARVARLRFKWHSNRAFFDGETEPCINGRILGLGAYFNEPNHALADQLLHEQLEDGGWNCEAPQSRRSSFHTTICVLEGFSNTNELAASPPPSLAPASGPKTICWSGACSARSGPVKLSTSAGSAFRSRRSGIMTCCVDWTICAMLA